MTADMSYLSYSFFMLLFFPKTVNIFFKIVSIFRTIQKIFCKFLYFLKICADIICKTLYYIKFFNKSEGGTQHGDTA